MTRRPGPAPRTPPRPHRPRLEAGDRGSASAELVLMVPLLMLVLFLLLYAARGAEARMRMDDAAHQAARAASQARSPAQAARAAEETAATALDEAGLACQHLAVDTAGTLRPGSTVTITLACTVGLQDLAALPLPPAVTLTATFRAPVDDFRATTTAPTRQGGAAP